jgi:hypothetical protein
MEGMDSSSRLSDAHARSALHSHVEQANLYASHTTAALHECRHGHLAPKLTTVTLRSTRTGFRSWIEPSSLCVGVPGARGLGCNRCRARLPGCPALTIQMRFCLKEPDLPRPARKTVAGVVYYSWMKAMAERKWKMERLVYYS